MQWSMKPKHHSILVLPLYLYVSAVIAWSTIRVSRRRLFGNRHGLSDTINPIVNERGAVRDRRLARVGTAQPSEFREGIDICAMVIIMDNLIV